MSIQPLLQLCKEDLSQKETVLRKPSKEVVDFGDSLQTTVDDLIDTMKHHKIAIGLSAPQINVSLKVSVINLNPNKAEPTLVIVNPKIISITGKRDMKKESCMSIPHFRGEVERRDKVNLTYQDRFGAKRTLEAHGFLARVILHEVDHLDGILYIDRMKDLIHIEPVEFFKDK